MIELSDGFLRKPRFRRHKALWNPVLPVLFCIHYPGTIPLFWQLVLATAVGGLGSQAADRVMRGPVQTAVWMVFLSSAAGWGLRVWIGLP